MSGQTDAPLIGRISPRRAVGLQDPQDRDTFTDPELGSLLGGRHAGRHLGAGGWDEFLELRLFAHTDTMPLPYDDQALAAEQRDGVADSLAGDAVLLLQGALRRERLPGCDTAGSDGFPQLSGYLRVQRGAWLRSDHPRTLWVGMIRFGQAEVRTS
jgi:hypothetical protein